MESPDYSGKLQTHQIMGVSFQTKKHLPQQRNIQQLWRETPGSTGLGMWSSSTAVMAPESPTVCLSTGVDSLPTEGMLGLIIGYCSTYVHGVNVLTGVTDPDFTGEIKNIVQPPPHTHTPKSSD